MPLPVYPPRPADFVRHATALRPLSLTAVLDGVSEAQIQDLVHRHPGSLPIDEVDLSFGNPNAICRELGTPAGAIDNLLVTASGLPILMECKLWRNPESRREVVGQIIDDAKELSRWTSSDLQREVSRRLGVSGNAMLDLSCEPSTLSSMKSPSTTRSASIPVADGSCS